MTFHELDIPQALIDSLHKMQISSPTPIQVRAIPAAIRGQDVLASSPTGSGKTLAYLLPLVTKLLSAKQHTALILTPTRELAAQVRDTLTALLPPRSFNLAMLIGGEAITNQLTQLRRKPQIVIGTPGRIMDHLMRKTLLLDRTAFLVLDETDRMLEMGFSEALEFIFRHLPQSSYQTFMFSATLPSFITKLAEKYLRDPERISLAGDVKIKPQIDQESVYIANREEKFPRLLTELNQREGTVIIFVKTKNGAEDLTFRLKEYEHKVEALHGNLRQHKRDRAIRAFRNQRCRIMVATDIASRGLDVPHIQHVINYDIPQCPEDYLHRIGRTGRAGAKGQAISLIAKDEMKQWRAISREGAEKTQDPYQSNRRPNAAIRSNRTSNNRFQTSGGSNNRFRNEIRNENGNDRFQSDNRVRSEYPLNRDGADRPYHKSRFAQKFRPMRGSSR